METGALAATVASSADPHVFLIGRPPITEFLQFVQTQTVEGQTTEVRALAEQWRAANDRIHELEKAEAGVADSPGVAEVPAELKSLTADFLADPLVQRSYPLGNVTVGMVDLDTVVVFQKFVNVAYAQQLRDYIGANPEPRALFEFCLPRERRYDPPITKGQTAQGGFVFNSPSTDFRILGAKALEPEQVSGLDVSGVPATVVAVAIGYGSNYLMTLCVDGRLVLWNGSHRAYALRSNGITRVPCVIQDVSRRDELEAHGGPDHPLNTHTDLLLTHPRPPLLKDYFDEQLHTVVHVPRRYRQVQLGFNGGQADLPAA
jgi:hypothetical protein